MAVVLPQQETILQYVADGATTIYQYNFLLPTENDVAVYFTPFGEEDEPDADILVLNVDYTVQGVGNVNGGTITFTVAPALDGIVTFSRDVLAAIETDFANAQTFNGATLDDKFEELTLMVQQIKTSLEQRSLAYKVTSYIPLDEVGIKTKLPILDDNQVWKGQGGGVIAATLEENPDVSTLRSDLASEAILGDGTNLIGYYDSNTSTPQTLKTYLTNIPAMIPSTTTVFKPGMMIDFAGNVAPEGWLACNGAAVSRTTYAALFAAISTGWGAGDGSTTFNVPDFRRRVAVGSGGTGSAYLGNTVGNVGGEEAHVQAEVEMAAHTHTVTFNRGSNYSPPLAANLLTNDIPSGTVGAISSSAGGSSPSNIMQPSAVVFKIIKI